MLLDEMHGEENHMMDWMSRGQVDWIFILAGWIIFLMFVVILLYMLNRGSKSFANNNDLRNQPIQDLSLGVKIDKTQHDRSIFCPNCGEKIDGKTPKYCPRCGNKIWT